jgi:hypothetical protein
MVLAGYAWVFSETGGYRPSRQPDGYYGYLTDALLSGQLNLKIEPDPRLAKLANPWLNYQGIPYLDDATYFHGHYYIYFGVAPVVLYYAPVRLLTGRFARQGSAAAVFALVGFLAGLWLLRRMVELQENRPGAGWQSLGVIVWGYASYAFVECQTTSFYTVPILCAFACLMTALVAIERALAARRESTSAWFMAAASLAWGMCVAGRPHYVLGLPLICVPLAYLLTRGPGNWQRRRVLALLAAAIIPAAVIGAGLAWYNYARFGSVSEFGLRYQFSGRDERFIRMWNPGMILPNLHRYALSGTFYTVYFPFFIPVGVFVGFLAWCPVSALAALLPASLLEKRLRADPRWVCIALCTMAAGLIHLFALSILPIGLARYNADFLPELLLAALFTAIAYFDASPRWPRAARTLCSLVLACAAAVSVSKLLFLALGRAPVAAHRQAMEIAFNRPTVELQSLAGRPEGPSELELSFAELPAGARTPILTTGAGDDILFAEGIDPTHLRLGFVHVGNSAIYGDAIAYKPGEHHQVEVDLGSLYPPRIHPFFRHWDNNVVDALLTRVTAKVDGRIVLHAVSNFYPSDQRSIRYCSVPPDATGYVPFRGRLYGTARLPIPPESEIRTTGWSGPVRLRLRFPKFENVHNEPLVETGFQNAADMIYVTYLGPTTIRFGHDSSQGGSIETGVVEYDPSVGHTLDVGLGSLEAPEGTVPSPHLGLRLKFDGHWLIATDRITHPSHPYQNVFGYNPRFGTANESFSGSLAAEHIDSPHGSEKLPGKGPLEVSLRFVQMLPNTSEPLVVSGKTGRGDTIFVSYLPGGQIQFGVDHWGVGSNVGPATPLQVGVTHTLIVSSAVFLPAADSPDWDSTPPALRTHLLSTIEVYLDGKRVLDAPWTAYEASDSQITVGENTIGGSTTGPTFSGTVLSSHHCPLGKFLTVVADAEGGSNDR